jgi:hypothetical protein
VCVCGTWRSPKRRSTRCWAARCGPAPTIRRIRLGPAARPWWSTRPASSPHLAPWSRALLTALSEVLHDMTLSILERKKEKAGAPDKLVAAVGLVDACTKKLETIATALANDEYEDFAAIKKEILDAAAEVKKGSADMAEATRKLQAGSEVESAWDGVGASVGHMVNKTMLLLEIVYGAQMRVLLQCSSSAQGALDNLAQRAREAGPHTDDDGVKGDGCSRQAAVREAQERGKERAESAGEAAARLAGRRHSPSHQRSAAGRQRFCAEPGRGRAQDQAGGGN